jgi:uncharacterized protein
MKIEGSFVLDVPVDEAWRYIRDPQFVASCLPGCESVKALTPTVYLAALSFALRPLNMRFNLEVEILSETLNSEVRFRSRGEEGGRASTVSSENLLRLVPTGDGRTSVAYSADVLVAGRLGRFGLGVMHKRVSAMGQEFAAQFGERVRSAVAT